MQHIFPLFLEHNRAHSLIRANDTVFAGFSGGKDSVAMVLLLQELQKQLPFTLKAAYFNHHLRPDSDEEAAWVARFCREYRIELVTGGCRVRQYQRDEKLNLEHAASLSRYDFFRRVSSGIPGAKIATAHTRSDLVETFFIKLFRGSGLQGLSAIYHKKENTIIRPLLLFSTEEVESFLSRQGVDRYQDPSNRDESFLRNRIRQRLIPTVLSIEPRLEERVLRTVMLLQDEYDYFQDQAQIVLDRSLILGAVLPVTAFRSLHPALQRHVAREYIRRQKGNLLHLGIEHIEALLEPESKGRGLSIPGLELRREKGYLFPASFAIADYALSIPRPGRVPIPSIGYTLCISRCHQFRKPPGNRDIIVPASRLSFPLTARSVKRGDAYRKIHSPYAQKVNEMIRASGMPHRLRALCPVLVNGDGRLVWVFGSPLADEFKVEPKHCPPFLRISLKPQPNPTGPEPGGLPAESPKG